MRYYFYSPSLSYGEVPRFLPEDDLPSEGFSSLYSVSQADAEAITRAGTCAKFAGVVHSDTIWLDVDSGDHIPKVEAKLNDLGYNWISYTTGNRGRHYGVHRVSEPSHLLPLQDKKWVEANFEGLVDTSIYTHLHLFRLPGTRHHKTGRPKEYLQGVTFDRWLELPKLDRTVARPSAPNPSYSGNGRSVFDCSRVMGHSVPAEVGERHASLVKLAYALKDEAEVGAPFAIMWMLEVNKMFREPKDEKEVENIVRKIFGEP